MRDPAEEALLDRILDEVEDFGPVRPGDERASLFEARAVAMTPGEPGRAAWFAHAGEGWEMAGDFARAEACYESALADGGPTWVDVRASLVGVLLARGESARVDQLLAELRRDLAADRAFGPVHDYVGEALELNGRLEEALRWFSAGLTYAQRDDPEGVDIGCLNGRFRVRRQLGLPLDRCDQVNEERRREAIGDLDAEAASADAYDDAPDRPALMTVLHWPAAELAGLLERWPAMRDDYGGDHNEHRSHVERHLRQLAARLMAVAVVDGAVDEYVEFAGHAGHDAVASATRAAYAAHLGFLGRTRPWPPGRNDRCWCGSGVKYKRCCGGLRFPPTESGD